MDGRQFSEMNEVCLTNQNYGFDQSLSPISGCASVGHFDGSVSIWNLSMRQCLA